VRVKQNKVLYMFQQTERDIKVKTFAAIGRGAYLQKVVQLVTCVRGFIAPHRTRMPSCPQSATCSC
jgi:hypothetical protein